MVLVSRARVEAHLDGGTMPVANKSLLDRIARGMAGLRDGASGHAGDSMLAQAARSYGARPVVDEGSVPTHRFDSAAAAVYEAMVEMTFLVAAVDGFLDDDARSDLMWLITAASNYFIQEEELEALLADLTEQLEEDGIEKRARMVSRTLVCADHQREGLRIAALTAYVFGGVSEHRRQVLEFLARFFQCDSDAVDQAIRQAEASLADTALVA
jgi:hypothetical protein